MASCDFHVDWSEAPDSEHWLPLWHATTEQTWDMGWSCVRALQRPYMVALCAAGPHSLLSASVDSVVMTDMQTWQQIYELADEDIAVTALLPLPHVGAVLCGSDDGTLRVWRSTDWTCARTMRAHQGGVHCLCAVGDRVLSAGSDATIRIWEVPLLVKSEWACHSVLHEVAPVTAVATAPLTAGGFFSGTDAGDMSFWQLDGVHWESEVLGTGHCNSVEAILRHSSTMMISIDCERLACWWEFTDGFWCVSRTVTPWDGPYYAIMLENLLLAGDADGLIKIWRKAAPGEAAPAEAPIGVMMEESDDEALDDGEAWDGSDLTEEDNGEISEDDTMVA